jgi:hypothetical protein
MFDEMNFLFDISNKVSNKVNTDNKTKSSANAAQSTYDKVELDEDSGDFYKNTYVVTSNDTKNFIKSDVNKAYTTDKKNPYLKLLEDFILKLNKSNFYDAPIVTEITLFDIFYNAEENHQNYYNQNSEQGYCDYTITPKIEKIKAIFSDKLK